MFWKHTTKNEEVEFNYIPCTVISDDLIVSFCKQYLREKPTLSNHTILQQTQKSEYPVHITSVKHLTQCMPLLTHPYLYQGI